MPGKDTVLNAIPPIVAEKLAAFDQLLPEFQASFPYVADVHGERRFERMQVAEVVRYLHALWVCDCKDMLLSVPRTARRYEGRRALQLLANWQQGEVADVVAFLQDKLDGLPFAEITRQWLAALRDGDNQRAERLSHGRRILLNRGFNLHAALDAIFTPPLSDLLEQAAVASAALDHTPEQIARQLDAMESEAYAYYPHPDLVRRNMLVMNALGVQVTGDAADHPGNRTWKVEDTSLPAAPYAQTMIAGAVEMLPSPHGTYAYFPQQDAVEVVEAAIRAATLAAQPDTLSEQG